MQNPNVETYVVGDVSATNILIGCYTKTPEDEKPQEVMTQHYNGKIINNFENEVLGDFLGRLAKGNGIQKQDITKAVFAPAAPIKDGMCDMTNAHFSVSAHTNPFETALINDFAAIGYAISGDEAGKIDLVAKAVRHSNGEYGNPTRRNAMMAVHGAGTGFGTSRLQYDKTSKLYFAISSEGGHKDLSTNPHSDEEHELAKYISTEYCDGKIPHLEAVLSGSGIRHVFEFFAGRDRDFPRLAREFEEAEDGAKYIAKKAKAKGPGTFAHVKTMDFFWKAYGRALRNLAVHEIAEKGVWVGGGIIRKDILDLSRPEKDQEFDPWIVERIVNEFDNGVTHQDWVNKIPINIILDEQAGVKGALAVASIPGYTIQEQFYKRAA